MLTLTLAICEVFLYLLCFTVHKLLGIPSATVSNFRVSSFDYVEHPLIFGLSLVIEPTVDLLDGAVVDEISATDALSRIHALAAWATGHNNHATLGNAAVFFLIGCYGALFGMIPPPFVVGADASGHLVAGIQQCCTHQAIFFSILSTPAVYQITQLCQDSIQLAVVADLQVFLVFTHRSTAGSSVTLTLFSSCTMGTLAESFGVATVNTLLVFAAPGFTNSCCVLHGT